MVTVAEIGVKGLLMKPITKSEIVHMLRKVLDEAKNSFQKYSLTY